jgi:hypothetical protein
MRNIGRSVVAVFCCAFSACGGNSSAVVTAPATTPVASSGLVLSVGSPSAQFMIDRGGGPGHIVYNLGCSVRVAEESRLPTMRVDRVETWLLGPDGSVYYNQLLGSMTGQKLGGISSTVGIGCPSSVSDDRNIDRPGAALWRVRLEFTFDGGSPAGTQVLTAEHAVAFSMPTQPLMTSLSMTSDIPGQPPMLQTRRPMKFAASGGGGRPPYEYEWRAGNNIVLRDWSPDATFVWDGTYTLGGVVYRPTSTDVTVMARGSAGKDAEVMKIMSVFLPPN